MATLLDRFLHLCLLQSIFTFAYSNNGIAFELLLIKTYPNPHNSQF